ncbi:MAG: hypothetical protein AB2813_04700 [Candidatus Sedimenticola endophacoides]
MLGIASGLPAQPRHSTNKRVLHSWSIPALTAMESEAKAVSPR